MADYCQYPSTVHEQGGGGGGAQAFGWIGPQPLEDIVAALHSLSVSAPTLD